MLWLNYLSCTFLVQHSRVVVRVRVFNCFARETRASLSVRRRVQEKWGGIEAVAGVTVLAGVAEAHRHADASATMMIAIGRAGHTEIVVLLFLLDCLFAISLLMPGQDVVFLNAFFKISETRILLFYPCFVFLISFSSSRSGNLP